MITKELLETYKACAEQVDAFRQRWTGGAEVTLANMVEAQDLGLNVFWLENLLPEQVRAAYRLTVTQARAAYEQVWAPAARPQDWAEYERGRKAAKTEYERIRRAALHAALVAAGGP